MSVNGSQGWILVHDPLEIILIIRSHPVRRRTCISVNFTPKFTVVFRFVLLWDILNPNKNKFSFKFFKINMYTGPHTHLPTDTPTHVSVLTCVLWYFLRSLRGACFYLFLYKRHGRDIPVKSKERHEQKRRERQT